MQTPWCVEARSGEAVSVQMTAPGILVITQISLLHPPSAAGDGKRVQAWYECHGLADKLGPRLSPARPELSLMRLGHNFTLYHDSADAVVRFDGRTTILDDGEEEEEDPEEIEPEPEDAGADEEEEDPEEIEPEPDDAGDEEEEEDPEEVVPDLGDDGEVPPEVEPEEIEPEPEDEDEDVMDEDWLEGDGVYVEPSDSDEEEDERGGGHDSRRPFQAEAGGEKGHFTCVKNTTGFMLVVDDVQTSLPSSGSDGGKEILVFYRYTRFSETCTDKQNQDVEVQRTDMRRLRFIVPPAGDPASSLAYVGCALAPLVYPELDRERVQRLWSSLVRPVSIPPQATRVQVMFDVGVVSSWDCTPERMARAWCQMVARWNGVSSVYHIGVDLRLPEPVLSVLCPGKEDEADEGSTRPAKRRKVVAGEDCPICLEELESGLVKWPGCSLPHVFHGKCLQRSLKESLACPLCRHPLYST